MNKLKSTRLAKRAATILKELESVKPLYSELDSITTQLVDGGFKFHPFDKSVLLLVDNFASKNTLFKTTAVKRHELRLENSRV